MSLILKKMDAKVREKIELNWPEVKTEDLWHRTTSDGYSTIPRCLSLIIRILNGLDKGERYDSTYLGLWCRAWDTPYVDIVNARTFAHEAGFSGRSPESSWRKRMRDLEEWGMIKSKTLEGQPFRIVLIMNPYRALQKLKNSGKYNISDADWETLIFRMSEIKATDLKEKKAIPQK